MNLTRHTDYGLRVLMVLTSASREGRERLPTSEISEHFGISLNHLQKVVQRLQKGGYVHTVRGRGGGLSLAMEPAEISVAAVVKHLEPSMHVVECFDGTACALMPGCALKPALAGAQAAFLAHLEDISLAQITPISRPPRALGH